MRSHLISRAAALCFGVLTAFFTLLLLLGLPPAFLLDHALSLTAGTLLLSWGGGLILVHLVRQWQEGRRSSLEALDGRLQLIRQGNYSIYLDCTPDSELRALCDTVNNLTQALQLSRRQLTDEQEKASYILDNMDSGLLLVDKHHYVRQCNTSAYKYLGGQEPLPGRPLEAVTENAALLQAVERALEQEISSVLDIDLTDTAGVVVSARVNPIAATWLGEKQGLSAVVILTNVTQTRQMEQMRSEFVANISHELKTPITSIRGFAELLQSGMVADPAQASSYLARILRESERMASLIEDILRLSSLEDKAVEEPYEWVDLAVLTDELAQSLSPQMAQRGIRLERSGRAAAYAYPEDLRQLLKNLMENAVKYNREGGSVQVRLVEEAAGCTITVSDTGIGIPIEHQARIFERFYRVDKGRSKREGGTGLGLSIVKHIAAKYGGQIHLTSKSDEGTAIKVTLPRRAEPRTPDNQ